jgi:hypothetical protein
MREALDRLVGRVRRQFVTRVLHVGVELVESACRQDVGESDRFDAQSAGHRLLGQVAHGPLVRDRSFDAQVLGVLSEQDRHQRRLAGAVSSDDAHLLRVTDRERYGVEDTPSADLYA